MQDDKNDQLQAGSRINVNERYELQRWSKKLGVTEERLKAAVSKAGTSAKAVEGELQRLRSYRT